MSKALYFIGGIVFVTFILPLIDSFVSFIIQKIEKFKARDSVDITLCNVQMQKMEQEANADPVSAIGFDVPENTEYQYNDDEESEDKNKNIIGF